MGIKVLYVASEELRRQTEFLEKRWEGALPISALQKQHIFQVVTLGTFRQSRIFCIFYVFSELGQDLLFGAR